MYCKNCGQEVDEKAVICPKCGCETGRTSMQEKDAPSTGLWILGFLIPIVGLILYLTEKDKNPQKAKSAGQGALWSVIIGAIIGVISGVAYGCMLGEILGNSYY